MEGDDEQRCIGGDGGACRGEREQPPPHHRPPPRYSGAPHLSPQWQWRRIYPVMATTREVGRSIQARGSLRVSTMGIDPRRPRHHGRLRHLRRMISLRLDDDDPVKPITVTRRRTAVGRFPRPASSPSLNFPPFLFFN